MPDHFAKPIGQIDLRLERALSPREATDLREAFRIEAALSTAAGRQALHLSKGCPELEALTLKLFGEDF